MAGESLDVIVFVFRKVSDQTKNDWRGEREETKKEDRPTSLAFSFHPLPTVFSLDICLAFARLCFLLSRTINENPREVLLEMLAGVVPPGSKNPDLISDKKMSFSAPVFRSGL